MLRGLTALLAVALCAASLDSELGVGKAINIFMRYGYLSICMRVVPRNDTEGWVFREPTVSVFRDVERLSVAPKPRQPKTLFDGDFHMEFCDNLKQLLQAYFRDFSFERILDVVPRNDAEGWVFREPTVSVFRDVERLSVAPQPRQPKKLFDGDFHMEFCDNLKQLLQAYFRDFSFERLERPWRAFTAGWPTDIMARNLGINSSFITGDHCYVLVRVSRYRETAKLNDLPTNIPVEDVVFDAIQDSTIGDTVSIADFIRKYGSHYIASYITGNSLYQVFVFSRSVYSRIKDRVKSKGVTDIPPTEISNFFSPFFAEHIGAVKVFVFSRTAYSMIKERLKVKGVSDITAKELEGYFSPWHAKHIGQIKVASGNKTVENWAMKRLRVHYYIFSYPSLLKLHGEPSLLRNLDSLLGNEALLQLELKTLSPAFKDVKKKRWFEEVIDNYLKLWESNM